MASPENKDFTDKGMVNAEGAVRRAIALARDPALAQLFQPLVLPGLEAVAGRLQPKQNLPLMQAPEVVQQVASGIHDPTTETTASLQPAKDRKQNEKPVDSVFARETSWTEPVAAAKAESDQVQGSSQQAAEKSATDDFWQNYGSVL